MKEKILFGGIYSLKSGVLWIEIRNQVFMVAVHAEWIQLAPCADDIASVAPNELLSTLRTCQQVISYATHISRSVV